MKKFLLIALFALANMLPAAFAGTLSAYISAPGAQSSSVAAVTTENFNRTAGTLASSGSLAIGSYAYTSTGTGIRINSGNNDGGACPSGIGSCSGSQTQFLAVSDNNVLSITLTQNAKYLGFWWSAGDAGNTIRFYDQNNTLLATYTAASLAAFLPNNSATHSSVNTLATYTNSSYYGNPTNGSNACCTYAYVNLALDNTSAYIKKIEVYQNPSPSAGGWFELDNMSVRSSVPSTSERGAWIAYDTITTTDPSPQNTDLSIALTNGVSSVANGGTTSYTLTVNNSGANNGDGAIVSFPSVSGITKTSVSCTVPSGSTAFCPSGTLSVSDLEGSGLIIPTLPAGTSLVFTINASISTVASSITSSATITLPSGSNVDTNAANNTATDTDQVTSTVGGTVTGLATNQTLTLLNNGGDNKTISVNGSFTFSTPINNATVYAVTVGTQPTGQTCTVTNGTGTATANITTVSVTCTSNTYTIGGSVTGLASNQSVVLLNNAGNSTTVSSNSTFTFSTAITYGGTYAVTVGTQPTGQTCTVTNGTSTATANVTNVTVTCTNNFVAPIPTLSEWAMIFMASLMAMFGIRRMRRQ